MLPGGGVLSGGGVISTGGDVRPVGGGATAVAPGTAYEGGDDAWFDQIKSPSPDGSMRGPCQLAHPAIAVPIAPHNTAYRTRVVVFADISLRHSENPISAVLPIPHLSVRRSSNPARQRARDS